MSKAPALSVRGLQKSYRVGDFVLPILKGVDLEVDSGSFVSIQGESGCGKTTLLNLFAGLETPDSGYVAWEGKSIHDKSHKAVTRLRATQIGIVFQAYHLVNEIDALQNVLLSLRIADPKGGGSRENVERAGSLLERVGLGDRRHQMPNTLSGGERQRVAIARALATKPRMILADEPTGNLDERTGNSIMDLLQNLCGESGTTLVLVTHNREHATRANRRLTLHDGALSE